MESQPAVIANISLSVNGLTHIPIDRTRTMTFIVGAERCEVPAFIADFLSPRISDLHRIDPTISEFEVTTELTDKEFMQYLYLARGESLPVTRSNLSRFASLCEEMGNEELLEAIFNIGGDLTVENVLPRLKVRLSRGWCVVDEFSYVASHFHRFKEPELSELPVDAFLAILSDPTLNVENEDSLFDFIADQVDGDPSFFQLFQTVCFQYLSSDRIERIVSWISDSFDRLTLPIWRAISQRLIDSKTSVPDSDVAFAKRIDCSLAEDDVHTGIIYRLKQTYGGDLPNVVIVTTSSVYDDNPEYSGSNLLELDSRFFYGSRNRPGQWFCYDFQQSRVELTNYAIRSYPFGPGHNHPRSWVVEGSVDGRYWAELDTQECCEATNKNDCLTIFPTRPTRALKMVRLRQIGRNHKNTHYLSLSAFELYGAFLEPESTP
jgi:hypothetical protein